MRKIILFLILLIISINITYCEHYGEIGYDNLGTTSSVTEFPGNLKVDSNYLSNIVSNDNSYQFTIAKEGAIFSPPLESFSGKLPIGTKVSGDKTGKYDIVLPISGNTKLSGIKNIPNGNYPGAIITVNSGMITIATSSNEIEIENVGKLLNGKVEINNNNNQKTSIKIHSGQYGIFTTLNGDKLTNLKGFELNQYVDKNNNSVKGYYTIKSPDDKIQYNDYTVLWKNNKEDHALLITTGKKQGLSLSKSNSKDENIIKYNGNEIKSSAEITISSNIQFSDIVNDYPNNIEIDKNKKIFVGSDTKLVIKKADKTYGITNKKKSQIYANIEELIKSNFEVPPRPETTAPEKPETATIDGSKPTDSHDPDVVITAEKKPDESTPKPSTPENENPARVKPQFGAIDATVKPGDTNSDMLKRILKGLQDAKNNPDKSNLPRISKVMFNIHSENAASSLKLGKINDAEQEIQTASKLAYTDEQKNDLSKLIIAFESVQKSPVAGISEEDKVTHTKTEKEPEFSATSEATTREKPVTPKTSASEKEGTEEKTPAAKKESPKTTSPTKKESSTWDSLVKGVSALAKSTKTYFNTPAKTEPKISEVETEFKTIYSKSEDDTKTEEEKYYEEMEKMREYGKRIVIEANLDNTFKIEKMIKDYKDKDTPKIQMPPPTDILTAYRPTDNLIAQR